MEFMFLYWTYPTVVDIQQSSPSYLEAPAISICNPIGYNFTALCYEFETSPCVPAALRKYTATQVCARFPMNCWDGELPEDYSPVRYNKFADNVELQPEDHDKLRTKLEDYLNCTIEYAGEERSCNMEYVLGSFYTRDELPQYCYTLYSLWGNPNKTRERFQKGAIMRLHFFLNASGRANPGADGMFRPSRNLPSSPAIQIAVHSPYFLPSPYLDGTNFLAGRAYEMRLTMYEKHLLPAPYQTNCTNYFEEWERRNGKGPINQMGVVQECRMKRFYEAMKCVPATVDYPHEYPICKMCQYEKCSYDVEADSCQKLADSYNQPCDSFDYSLTKEQRVISIIEEVDIPFMKKAKKKEGVRWRLAHFDCDGHNFWSLDCSTIDIDVLFDRFEITTLTYNPKFESLELFSVIGGYLGMWLGISLVTVYDFVLSGIGLIRKYGVKWHQKKRLDKVTGYPAYNKGYGKNFRSRDRSFVA
ncbi:uncharacterized protein CDAR_480021 [Caerostris darwini]|uniref:Amiloride-sensitive sodium channel n=1 Tax=Caerostris darwini TaxID=1538125 RepID=A0AAV4T2L2_9ARAC|nr:uncharacterized protein CDAR_480021 [Caerostris darwini]